jgi:hypothetical protein
MHDRAARNAGIRDATDFATTDESIPAIVSNRHFKPLAQSLPRALQTPPAKITPVT